VPLKRSDYPKLIQTKKVLFKKVSYSSSAITQPNIASTKIDTGISQIIFLYKRLYSPTNTLYNISDYKHNKQKLLGYVQIYINNKITSNKLIN